MGIVRSCPACPAWEGVRVVGEINCPLPTPPPVPPPPPPPPPGAASGPAAAAAAAALAPASDPAAATARNHAPDRTVLGIIGRDGCAAEWVVLPASNLHRVPAPIPDARAAFVEPLAAACRIVEQGLVRPGQAVAVVGDGRLGLLAAAVLSRGGMNAAHAPPALAGVALTHFGHTASKLALLPRESGHSAVVVPRDDGDAAEAVWAAHAARFDVAVEATGHPGGAALALRLLRPGGTLVLKSTCAPTECSPPTAPAWSAFANDVVVQERTVVGSRCGPFPPALALLEADPAVGTLVDGMVSAEFDLAEGEEALRAAGRGGAIKVVLVTAAGRERER